MSNHSLSKTDTENGVVIPPMRDEDMAAILTAQYAKACNAMPEILRFGAMMIQIEEKLNQAGSVSKGGRGNKGGIRDWLRTYAPNVAQTTALRFRDITLGVAVDYPKIVGAKVAKQFALPNLVTASPEELPENARKKQQAIFDYVAGTSKQSWLDKLRPPKPSGGKTYERGNGKGARKKLTHAQAMELLRAVTVNAMEHLRFLHDKHAYVAVSDEAELDGLLNHLEETTKDVRAWKQMNQAERSAALAERVKLQIKEGGE